MKQNSTQIPPLSMANKARGIPPLLNSKLLSSSFVKIMTSFMLLFMFVNVSNAQSILTFDFAGIAGSEATANSNSNNANLTSSTISRGAGLTSSANADRFNATSWALTSIANAVTGNDYMEFTITPNSGFQFSVSSIVFQIQRSGTGLTAVALRSSADGYASNLDAQKSITDNTTTQTITFTFTQSNSTSAVTYRLYGFAEQTAGTGGPGDGTGNDITVNGTVTTTSSALISTTGSLSALSTTYGTSSTASTVSVSGSGLTADITATAPTGFEVSNGGSYGATTTFAQSGGTASGTLSVRLKADAAVTGSYNSQNIVLSSTGATNVNVSSSASGNSVTAAALTITGVSSTNKIYNATAIGSLTGTATYVGLQNSESFSVTGTPVATFAQSTVGTGIGVTVTGYTAPSTNYTVSQPSVSNADITAKPLTISGLTANNKVFDNTTTATLSGTATLVGVETADISNVTIGGAYVADFASAAVGTGIAVTVTGYSLSGSASGNYSLTQPSGLTADITASAVPTITGAATATAFTTTYGSPSTAQNFSVSGVDLTDDITATAPTGFEVSNGGAYGPTTTFTQAGGTASGTLSVRLRANAAVTGTYNSINVVLSSTGAVDKNITTSASGNSVSAAALTVSGITASNKVYDGNTTASLNTGSAAYVGLVNSESFSVTGTITGTFANKNVGTGKTVTIVGVDAPSTNYTVTQPTTTANITLAPLTISSPSVTTKAFDGNTNATITGTLSGIISPDVVTLVGIGTFASSAVGTGISVTSTSTLAGAGATNYEINPQPSGLTGTITAAPVLYNFGTTATQTSAPTSGTPVANLTFGNVNGGNNAGTAVYATLGNSNSTGYTGSTGQGNATIGTLAGSFNNNTSTYFTVTITPDAGYQVNLYSLSFGSRQTSTGPLGIVIRTSADNFAADAAAPATVLANSAWALNSFTFSTPIQSASGTPLVVRIYGYNGSASATNSANFRIDDLSINADGTLTPPPTSSVLSGTGSFCAGSFTNLSVAVTGGASPYTVVVSDGGANTFTVTSVSPVSIPVNAVGTYTITSVTDANSGVGAGNSGSAVVTQNASSLPTSVGTYTNTFNHAQGLTNLYVDNSCNIIANVQDAVGGNILGSTSVSSDITSAVLVANNNLGYVPRIYTITPSSNGAATVTLYYTQADFNAYNSSNGTQLDIATGPADATGIGNIRLRVATGGNINTGSLTNYTPSVSWNATDSRWEVTATLTDMGMLYLYGEPTCATAITNIISSNLTPTSVQLDWDNAGVSSYGIRIRVQGSPTWLSNTNSSTTTKAFNGLNPNTTYEVQIRAICSSSPQSFGAYYQTSFTTQSLACSTPSAFGQSAVTATSATITWNSVAAANSFSIRFKPNASGVWNNTSSATNSRTFNGLTPNTLYDVEVRTNCTNFASSYSAYQFTTAASTCTPVTNIAASAISSNSATLNWDNVSSANSYAIRLKPNTSSTWNNTSSTSNTRVFNGLQSNTLYDVEIRSNCTGEASSYVAAQFTTAASTCTPVTNIVSSAITMTSATLNWDNVGSANNYAIRIKPNSSLIWNNTSSATNTRVFNSLQANTLYDVEIRSNCTGEASSYVSTQFTTLSVNSKTTSNALSASIYNFQGQNTAQGHQLNWSTLSEDANHGFNLLHSTDGQNFASLATVATKAKDGSSEDVLMYDYLHTTPGAGANYYRLEMVAIDGSQTLYNQIVRLDQSSIQHQVTVTPNPTHDIVKVTFMSLLSQQTSIKVMDMTGRVVKVVQATSQEGMNTLDVNLNELAAGMYTLHLLENNKLTHISKIQKQD